MVSLEPTFLLEEPCLLKLIFPASLLKRPLFMAGSGVSMRPSWLGVLGKQPVAFAWESLFYTQYTSRKVLKMLTPASRHP